MPGSEGTLGIITELTLRLVPLPRYTQSLAGLFSSPENALAAVSPLRRRFSLRTLEYMESDLVRLSQDGGRELIPEKAEGQAVSAVLLLALDGDDESALERCAQEAGGCLLESGALDVLLCESDVQGARLMALRESLLETVKRRYPLVEEVDAAVPVPATAAYLAEARSLCAEEKITLCVFGHAADGNLHLYLCGEEDTTALRESCRALSRSIIQAALRLGGVPSGEHGLGAGGALALCGDPVYLRLMRGVKALFDPQGIMNPGKIIPE